MPVDFDIHCTAFRCERCRYLKPNIMKNFHAHDFYEIFLLESGNHCFVTDEKIYNLSTYDVALFKPGQLHKSKNSFPYSRICIYFTDEFMQQYFNPFAIKTLMKCFEHNIISLGQDSFEEVHQMINNIQTENVSEEDNKIFLHLAQILHILYENRFKSPIRMNEDKDSISKIITYICNNYDKINNIDDIAEQFYLSKYHLCRTFKEKTGFTLVNYINSVRIQNACEKLLSTNFSISEIALECGFNSSVYFCQVFKKLAGYTPNDFRTIYASSSKRQSRR